MCYNIFRVYQNGRDRDEGETCASCECDKRLYQVCSPDYKSLITIHNKKLKGSLKDKLKTDGELRRLSWSETTLEKASESHGTDIIRYFSNLAGCSSLTDDQVLVSNKVLFHDFLFLNYHSNKV